MPFTLSHPAAVVNIVDKNKNYFNNGALIIGTMAPDFEYFIFFKPRSIIGHKLIGCFILNLPLVFVTYLLFYKFIKKPLIEHLPEKISKKFGHIYSAPIALKSPKDYLIFIISALFGMFTHIVWDGFTHNEGFFVKSFSIFKIEIFGVYLYKILQHGSTLIGAIIIILYIKNLKDTAIEKISNSSKIRYWTYTLTISLFILSIVLILIPNRSIGTIVVSIMNSFFLGILIVSIFCCIKCKKSYRL